MIKIIMAGAESGGGHAGGWHSQFSPCPQRSLALRTEGDGNFGPRVAGSGFPGPPPLLCCDRFVAFAPGRTFLNRRALVGTVLGSLTPRVRVGTERFQTDLRVCFKHFLGPPWERFPCSRSA